ncbi:MAG: cytochrome c3 family protein [Lentimicrobiaceae bacterium]|nr:cytochrome c3 family protein [Lentimicrobiaceae bacterium]
MRRSTSRNVKVLILVLFAGLLFGSYLFRSSNQYVRAAGAGGGDVWAPHSDLEEKQGERLFLGLIPFRSGFTECAACHYTQTADTINWNPSVFDLADAYTASSDTAYLKSVMTNPSQKMLGSHAKIELTDKEYTLIAAYLKKVKATGLARHKPIPVDFMIFLGSGLAMLLALLVLLFGKNGKYKAIPALVLIVAFAFHMKVLVHEAIDLSRTQNYAPDQPIKFSHKIHSGENGIDCEYCHYTALESKSAGIPPVSLCLNCHNVIRNGTQSGRFEINKIHAAVKSGKPVEWIRVHNLPDHAFFSHAQHVQAGKVECQTCHGPVEEMHVLKQHSDLSMGWCVNCHRDTEVHFSGNAYYSIYSRLQEELKAGSRTKVTVEDVGGLDCMKCHY